MKSIVSFSVIPQAFAFCVARHFWRVTLSQPNLFQICHDNFSLSCVSKLLDYSNENKIMKMCFAIKLRWFPKHTAPRFSLACLGQKEKDDHRFMPPYPRYRSNRIQGGVKSNLQKCQHRLLFLQFQYLSGHTYKKSSPLPSKPLSFSFPYCC